MSFSMTTPRRAASTCIPASASRHGARPSLSLMLRVWSERRALAKMDETRLADLGLSPIDAARESARPIWDVPQRSL